MTLRLAAVAVALSLAACSTALVPEAEASDHARRRPLTETETCAMLVDVAKQVGEGLFDFEVRREDGSKINCEKPFRAAGLSIFPISHMNDPDVAMSVQDRGYVFSEPRFTDDTEAVVPMDFICRALCGHGEEITVRLQNGRWVIIERKTTWIS